MLAVNPESKRLQLAKRLPAAPGGDAILNIVVIILLRMRMMTKTLTLLTTPTRAAVATTRAKRFRTALPCGVTGTPLPGRLRPGLPRLSAASLKREAGEVCYLSIYSAVSAGALAAYFNDCDEAGYKVLKPSYHSMWYNMLHRRFRMHATDLRRLYPNVDNLNSPHPS